MYVNIWGQSIKYVHVASGNKIHTHQNEHWKMSVLNNLNNPKRPVCLKLQGLHL